MPFGTSTAPPVEGADGKAAPRAFGVKARKLFLDRLSETSNVSASARAAGVSSREVYRQRLRSAEFRTEWEAALAEGYVRLETTLLSDALIAASGNVSDKTLKARAQKIKLGLTLLSSHRASVRGGTPASSRRKVELQGTAKSRMVARLREMRSRMAEAPEPC